MSYCNRRFWDVFLHFGGKLIWGWIWHAVILECIHRFKFSYWRFGFCQGYSIQYVWYFFNDTLDVESYLYLLFPWVGWFNHLLFFKSFLTKLTPWYLTPWYSQDIYIYIFIKGRQWTGGLKAAMKTGWLTFSASNHQHVLLKNGRNHGSHVFCLGGENWNLF